MPAKTDSDGVYGDGEVKDWGQGVPMLRAYCATVTSDSPECMRAAQPQAHCKLCDDSAAVLLGPAWPSNATGLGWQYDLAQFSGACRRCCNGGHKAPGRPGDEAGRHWEEGWREGPCVVVGI